MSNSDFKPGPQCDPVAPICPHCGGCNPCSREDARTYQGFDRCGSCARPYWVWREYRDVYHTRPEEDQP